MKYTIIGKNLDVTDGLREYIEKKLSKLNYYFREETEIHVALSVERNTQKVEVTIPINRTIIRAEKATDDMYLSIDTVEEIVERQLRRNRKKLIDRTQSAKSLSDVFLEENIAEEEKEPEIVRVKKFPIGLMTPEEAADSMELLGHTFFVFRNKETEVVNVVYKRADGNYGLIEAEY